MKGLYIQITSYKRDVPCFEGNDQVIGNIYKRLGLREKDIAKSIALNYSILNITIDSELLCEYTIIPYYMPKAISLDDICMPGDGELYSLGQLEDMYSRDYRDEGPIRITEENRLIDGKPYIKKFQIGACSHSGALYWVGRYFSGRLNAGIANATIWNIAKELFMYGMDNLNFRALIETIKERESFQEGSYEAYWKLFSIIYNIIAESTYNVGNIVAMSTSVLGKPYILNINEFENRVLHEMFFSPTETRKLRHFMIVDREAGWDKECRLPFQKSVFYNGGCLSRPSCSKNKIMASVLESKYDMNRKFTHHVSGTSSQLCSTNPPKTLPNAVHTSIYV